MIFCPPPEQSWCKSRRTIQPDGLMTLEQVYFFRFIPDGPRAGARHHGCGITRLGTFSAVWKRKKKKKLKKKKCRSVFGLEPLISIFYFAHKRRGALSSVRLSRSIWISGRQRLKARADCGIPCDGKGPIKR